ncbi:DUF2690 domain-containing protein [Streptomyces sp. NPDC059785]|uniref:DUF2690 domain-containing protein n=1 Tax=unclassified Streptomyces TaxID=2593676 RepID=UPI00365955D1
MRISRRITSAAVTPVLLAAVLLTGGQPAAHAAPYDGSDPVGTGCDASARTVGRADIGGGDALLELRYSSGCKTAWARITITNGRPCEPGNDNCARAIVHRDSDGLEYGCQTEDDPARHSCYTAQVNDDGVTSYAHGSIDVGPYTHTGETGHH